MATIAYFCSAQFIKNNTPIDENVDEKYLMIAIKEAQEKEIRRYIGTGLYNELVSQVTASTLTALNTTLLTDYIRPALKYWVMYEAAPFLKFKFTNKNVVVKNSDNSSNVDMVEFEKVMKFIEQNARYYSKMLVSYLVQNQTSYPLYLQPGTGVDTIFPDTEPFDSDIYLGTGFNMSLTTPKQYYNGRYEDWK
jgi:hypothetical protein